MPVLCRPAVWVPENTISMDETLSMCRRLHPRHEKLPLVLRMIENTGVARRHLIQPLEQTLRHHGFEARNELYVREAQARIPAVVRQALASAGVSERDIDAIVFVSCTGFTMPPLTAWMINELGFQHDTRQIPIAQLGCAAGGAAINRAHDFCVAHPDANALIVTCEFCSLCYQPTDTDVGALLSDGLFGDAIAAAVVLGGPGDGMRLERNAAHLVPGTEDWIAYDVRATGFHFRLDKRVPGTMSMLAPALHALADAHGWDSSNLDFYIIHAGGPRILDDLSHYLGVPRGAFRHSRATLTEYGNIASAVVLDALRRQFDEGLPAGARGMLAGFGPGITAEASLGIWTTADTDGVSGANGRATDHFPIPAPRRQCTSHPREKPRNAMTTSVANPPKTFALGGDRVVNRLGYGAMHLTGPGFWGPPQDPQQAIRLLRRAVHEFGVNFIDTADSYGPGYNEQIIREALHPYPGDLVIATKGGMLRSGPDDWVRAEGRSPYIVALGRPDYLRQQVELSLHRLGLDRIDLYQLHRIDPSVPLEDQLGVLAELQQQGKIRHIGLSGQPEVTFEQLDEARRIVDIVAVENLYNIADRTGEPMLRHTEEQGIAFIPWFPLGHGDLVGPTGVLTRAAAKYGVTGAQLGLAWLLRRSPNVLLIPGTTSIRHLAENLEAADVQLDESQWANVEELCSRATVWRPEAAVPTQQGAAR
ncbi:aldo/keto reductase [Lentzea roselyniae]|uniref:aldo/keto reductase n=1 Tax=Lentzea roselyniae TaxID=531940 RepID=UPI0031F8CEF2